MFTTANNGDLNVLDTHTNQADGEDPGEENLGPIQACHRDINDLGILLMNPLVKELSEEDLKELQVAAFACDMKLKALK